MSDIMLRSDIYVDLIQDEGGDHMVVAAAKVSTDPDDALQWAYEEYRDDARGLINFLMKHRHGSPFEHGMMTFYVNAPIFVWREWHRHRAGWSYNETSGRYRKLEPTFWVPRADRPITPREPYKPARPRFDPLPAGEAEAVYAAYRTAYQHAWELYTELIGRGVSNEAARAVLPVGIYSQGWATCNPRSLMHFLSLRTHEPDAQYVSYPQQEIEEAARQMEAAFAHLYPLTYSAWEANGRVAP